MIASLLETHYSRLKEQQVKENLQKEILALNTNLEKEIQVKSRENIDLNHKIVDQITIDKLPVIQNSIIEEVNFINERGKILNNGIVSISCIINKNFDNLKMQIYNKGFPFSFNSQLIEEEIKEIFLNKVLFIKDDLNEETINNLLLDISKKTFSRNFSLKPEFFIHISLI